MTESTKERIGHISTFLSLSTAMIALIAVMCGCSSTEPERELFYGDKPTPPVADNDSDMTKYEHLTISSTWRDVVEHPAFRGFGRYILPGEWGYEPGMPLSDIPSLLPYHNYVDADRTVGYINRMIDMRAEGQKLYHDLGRKDAGLFFFPGQRGKPFAIFCPGGGFSYVGSIHEGFPPALEMSRQGYNAFVIQYSCERDAQGAVEDLAAGIDYIFSHAAALGVDTACYSVWGGSAGARMAAYIGSHTPAAFGALTTARPATVVMGYTGHSEYTAQDPPTYVVIGENDGIASPATMRHRVETLRALGIDAEFHLFPNLRHGFGLGTGTSADGWIYGAIKFWEKYLDKTGGVGIIPLSPDKK